MKTSKTTISRLQSHQERIECARIFSVSEPWLTLQMTDHYFLQILSDSLNETYIMHVEGQIAGIVIVQMQGPFSGYIKSIVIVEKWRGKGHGCVLLDFIEQRIFKDSPNVFLCVSSFNTDAQRFYEKRSYQKIGILENYVITGQSEILLRKTLGPTMKYKQSR